MKTRALAPINEFLKSDLIANTVLVAFGSLLGGFFNYLMQIALSRLMSLEDFGAFNSLNSIFLILSVPIAGFSNALIKEVSSLHVKKKLDELTRLYYSGSLFSILLGMVFMIALFLSRRFTAGYLRLEDTSALFWFSFLGIGAFLIIWPSAFLQGLLKFKKFSFFSILSGFLRASFAVMFFWIFKSLGSTFLGIFLNMVILYLLSFVLLKNNFTKITLSLNEVSFSSYRPLLKLSLITTFVTIGMTLLNNIDVIMVKHYFAADLAGLYSAVVTIGKIYLFTAGVVVFVMYPQISSLVAANKDVRSTFIKFFFIQLLVAGVGLLFFWFFSEQITNALFDSRFDVAIPYLQHFSLFIFLYIISNFLIMFLISIGDNKGWILVLFAVFVQYLLITFKHANLNEVINNGIIASGILLVSLTIYCLSKLKNVSFGNSAGLQAGVDN